MFYNKRIFERCFYHRGRYWYKNIKEIPLYFKLMHHLIKYGYDEYAEWETFNWFINTMQMILPRYRDGSHWGVPIVLENYNPYDPHLDLTDEENEELVKKNEEEWFRIIDRMLELLDLMDERNYSNCYNYEEQEESMNNAKNEFFELFSKYFYNLWD